MLAYEDVLHHEEGGEEVKQFEVVAVGCGVGADAEVAEETACAGEVEVGGCDIQQEQGKVEGGGHPFQRNQVKKVVRSEKYLAAEGGCYLSPLDYRVCFDVFEVEPHSHVHSHQHQSHHHHAHTRTQRFEFHESEEGDIP